jgi:hypothetical protein
MKATVLVLLAGGCGGAAVTAERKVDEPTGVLARPVAAKPQPIDVTSVRDQLTVFTDGQQHYIVALVPDPEQPQVTDPDLHLFYGDGKEFASVKVYTSHADGLKFEIGFDDPRVPVSPLGSVTREKGKTVLTCMGKNVDLTALPADQQQQMLAAARFVRRTPAWRPYALSDDGKGSFVYIDHGNTPDNHEKWRLFMGKPGAMSEVAVTHMDHDRDWNDVTFITAKGTLKAKAGRDAERNWVANLEWEGSPPLLSRSRAASWKLIFHELGVYDGRTPTPCEPMF